MINMLRQKSLLIIVVSYFISFLGALFILTNINSQNSIILAYDCESICRNECRRRGKNYNGATCLSGDDHKCQCCNKTTSENLGRCTFWYYSCSGTLHDCHGGTGEHYRCIYGDSCTTSTVHMGCCNCDCSSTPPNQAPTCTIDFPTDGGTSYILYDAKQYYDSNHIVHNDPPTARAGKINTSDPDGDPVTITDFTVSGNCIKANRNGENFTLTPQGEVTGVSPNLDNYHSCTSTLTAYIKDNHNHTASCTKTVQISYPITNFSKMCLLDKNNESVSPDFTQNPPVRPSVFNYVGSTAPDVASYAINVVNNTSPTRELPPITSRFTLKSIQKGDSAPFQLFMRFHDQNGNLNMKLQNGKIYLRKTDGSFQIPFETVPSSLTGTGYTFPIYVYGVNRAGHLVHYNSGMDFTPCLNDTNSIVCIKGNMTLNLSNGIPRLVSFLYTIYPKEDLSFPTGQYEVYFARNNSLDNTDAEGVKWRKYQQLPITALANIFVGFRDNYVKTYQTNNCNQQWTGNNALFIDGKPPVVDVLSIDKVNANTIDIKVKLTEDSGHFANSYPIYRTYFFAENDDSGKVAGVENRFLRTANGYEIKAEDTVGNNKYDWQLISSNSNSRTYELKVTGLLGGDNIIYGFCVADRAGNQRCCDSDVPGQPGCNMIDSGSHLHIGSNWVKTSLGYLYSGGGFSNLPDYGLITNVYETPSSVSNFVAPFNATDKAVLSTFTSFSYINNLGNVDFGYNNNHKHEVGLPYFYKAYVTFNNNDWVAFFQNIISKRCRLLANCTQIAVNDAAGLANALQTTNTTGDPDNIFKIITIRHSGSGVSSGANLVLPSKLTIRGKNIVLVGGYNRLKMYQIYKPDTFSNQQVGLIVIGYGNSQVIVDDKKNEDFDNNNTDLVQAGFIILQNSQFKEIQGLASNNRDAYKDSNGKFDKLILHGFLYSQTLPVLERDLGIDENEHNPSEWFIYDANLMNLFEPILGKRKIQTTNCIMNNSPLCKN